MPLVLAVVLCAIGMGPDPGSAAAPYLCGTRLIEGHAGELPLPDPPLQAAKPSSGAEAGRDLPDIGVGTRQEFVVAGSPQLMPATCRYAGERVFVFVEDRQWDTNGGSILQSHVDGLVGLFERSTPADPGRGIHDLCTEAFGPVPDVDGYPQVFLLILDIADPRLVGFFDARVAGHEVPGLRRDILYVDEWFVRRQTYLARGTLAHEFQHLIHWGQDEDEEIWLNEGMSGYAEALTGFPEADSTVCRSVSAAPGRRPDGVGKPALELWIDLSVLGLSRRALRRRPDPRRRSRYRKRNRRHRRRLCRSRPERGLRGSLVPLGHRQLRRRRG